MEVSRNPFEIFSLQIESLDDRSARKPTRKEELEYIDMDSTSGGILTRKQTTPF